MALCVALRAALRLCLVLRGSGAVFGAAWLWGCVWCCVALGLCLVLRGSGAVFGAAWLWGCVWCCVALGLCLVLRGSVAVFALWLRESSPCAFEVWSPLLQLHHRPLRLLSSAMGRICGMALSGGVAVSTSPSLSASGVNQL